MYFDLVTAPANEPVTTAEAKDHLLIDTTTTDFDTYIALLIKASRKFIEARTGYICNASTWALYLDTWKEDALVYINKKPITAITKVEYIADGTTTYTTLTPADYHAAVKHNPPVVKLLDMPNLADIPNAVKITFTAGHTASADIPEYITQAIKILLRQMFENRTEEVTGTIVSKLDKGFEYLLTMAEQYSV
jgi:uncharacterized phiE125 gp8 family phage protein